MPVAVEPATVGGGIERPGGARAGEAGGSATFAPKAPNPMSKLSSSLPTLSQCPILKTGVELEAAGGWVDRGSLTGEAAGTDVDKMLAADVFVVAEGLVT